jgi:Na+-driven multidrug efflux pump
MFIVLFGLALNVAGNSLIVSFDVSHAHWIAVVTTVSRLAMAIAAWIAFRRFFEKRSAVGQDKEAPARKKIIQFGWATTISAAGTMVLAVFGLIAGLKGVVVAAAFQIILNLAQFCLNFINGILTGVSVKVGKAYTASRPAEVRYYAWSGMAINFGLSVILFGFFVLFSDPILGLYTESQEVVGETLSLLLSVGLAFLLADAFVRVCSVTARSIGNRTYTTVLTVLTYVSSVVAGYVLCVVYQAEIIVLFYSMIAANLMIGFGIMIRFPPYFIPSAQTVSQ